MKIFVMNPDTGTVHEFEETTAGQAEAIDFISEVMAEGYEASEVGIIRGVRLLFLPPSSRGELIPASN